MSIQQLFPAVEPPALQPGDPGAEPPPVGLEPERKEDPLAALAVQAVDSAFQAGRYQTALIELLCGLGSMANLTIAAVRALRVEDMRMMTPVTGRLSTSLRELADSLEAKQLN
jgi:hypothetical protein